MVIARWRFVAALAAVLIAGSGPALAEGFGPPVYHNAGGYSHQPAGHVRQAVQSTGYGQPVRYVQPAGYVQPVRYGQPVGYGQPVTYGQPVAYGQPVRNAQPAGYGYRPTAYGTRPDGYSYCTGRGPCGPWGLEWITPQGVAGADFRPHCAAHDRCYSMPGVSRAYCDRQFSRGLHSACRNSRRPVLCHVTAGAMSVVTRLFGGLRFRASQRGWY